MSQYQCRLLNLKSEWENFVLSKSEANFLQSYNWGQFQQQLGKSVFPIAAFNQDDKQAAAALVIKEEAKRGGYLSIAGGPLLNWSGPNVKEILDSLIPYLYNLAKQENCWFVRIRPQVEDAPKIRQLVQDYNFKQAQMHLTADLTLELDLSASEKELLMQMRKNTRYSVRKSRREGIKVEQTQDLDFIQTFYDYQLYLADKHEFVPFSYQFLKEQFAVFKQDDQVMLFNAYHEQDLLASAYILFYNQEAVYHYGISTPKNKKLPGSYAVLWAAIKEAKRRGCRSFNFWGIAPDDEPDHRFAGVSIFKRGFGGEEVQYLPAHDLPVNSFYWLTRVFEWCRRKKRNL
mgnify:CR=1 FL=1